MFDLFLFNWPGSNLCIVSNWINWLIFSVDLWKLNIVQFNSHLSNWHCSTYCVQLTWLQSIASLSSLILEPLGGVVEAAGLGEHARGLGGHVVHALVQDPQPGLPFLTCSRPGSSNQPHNNLAIIPSYPTRNLRNTFDAICTFRAFGSTSGLKLHFVDWFRNLSTLLKSPMPAANLPESKLAEQHGGSPKSWIHNQQNSVSIFLSSYLLGQGFLFKLMLCFRDDMDGCSG